MPVLWTQAAQHKTATSESAILVVIVKRVRDEGIMLTMLAVALLSVNPFPLEPRTSKQA